VFEIVRAEQNENGQYTFWLKDLDIKKPGDEGRKLQGTEAELRDQLKAYTFSANELDNQFQNARNAAKNRK